MTPRHPSRESIGKKLMIVTRGMGREPMPWQADIFERAYEVDSFGQLWYREIVVVVPRQSGKTTLVIPWGVHRCIGWPDRQFMVYTAQTRAKALEKLEEEQHHWIKRSPFDDLLVPNRRGDTLRLSHGAEHMRWANGSKWAIDAPTEDAGHGGTLGLTVGDEIFAQKDARLEAGFAPATTAVPDSQMLWISTVGKSKQLSPFLWDKMRAGRARTELALVDPSELDRSRTLYVEFSAAEDTDWMDPLTWWLTMPALGYTTTEAKIAAFADSMQANNGAEFRRAYLNQWPGDLAQDWKIPRDRWFDQVSEESELSKPLVWVIDIAPDRSWASIAAAWRRADGDFQVEVIDDGPGTDWLIDGDGGELRGIAYLTRTYGGEVYYDHVTVGAIVPDLVDADIESHAIGSDDIKVAAPMLLDYVLNRRVWHIGQDELTDALGTAQTAPFGDGWRWSRGKSLRPISSLVAVTLALRMLAKLMPELTYDPVAALREALRP